MMSFQKYVSHVNETASIIEEEPDHYSKLSSRHPLTIVAVDSALISSQMSNLPTTLRRQITMLRTTGTLTSLAVTTIRNIRLTTGKPIAPVMIIPGYQDLSPRNLALFSTDLQFLRNNQQKASIQLADRLLKPLHKLTYELNQAGTIVWCSMPPSCPDYLKKPYPIPHIIHHANIIAHRAISKLNAAQKLPHLNVTDGLHTVMISVIGRFRATKRPACQNSSRYLTDGRRFTTKTRSNVFAKICHNIGKIHQGVTPHKIRKQASKSKIKQSSKSSRSLPRSKSYRKMEI